MRILKSDSGDELIVDGLGETELDMLHGVRDAADPTLCPAAEKRLFPEPISDVSEEDLDAVADWKEFVIPDLRSQFDEALDRFERDIGAAEMVRRRPLKRYRITIAHDHVGHWYSALNQARLVLQEKFGLPNENDGLSLEKLFASGRWRPYFQSRFYAEVQCWLLESGME